MELNSVDVKVSRQGLRAEQINLVSIVKELWRFKWLVFITMFITAAVAVYAALQMPNIYRTTTVLAPATEKKAGLGGLGSQLGGLASLAGVSLSGAGGVDKTDLAVELLKSKQFLSRFIKDNQLLLPLMAAKGWDLQSSTFIFDNDIYDEKNKLWVRTVVPPRKPEPSFDEAAAVLSALMEISKDKVTGMVKLSFEHLSPELVQLWVQQLVVEVNQTIRHRDMQEAQSSLNYLSKQLQDTKVAEIRSSLAQLIEEQTKTLMLANIREDYVLKVVDPAFLPDEKIKPRRSLVVLMSMFGMALFLMIIGYVRLLFIGRAY
ncbi:MAG: LPS O-antigen length regulator [Gammaproteobacteria bacterium]|nr:LPS O-antigen length regulator [Gammaproteobacteria bacterium]